MSLGSIPRWGRLDFRTTNLMLKKKNLILLKTKRYMHLVNYNGRTWDYFSRTLHYIFVTPSIRLHNHVFIERSGNFGQFWRVKIFHICYGSFLKFFFISCNSISNEAGVGTGFFIWKRKKSSIDLMIYRPTLKCPNNFRDLWKMQRNQFGHNIYVSLFVRMHPKWLAF